MEAGAKVPITEHREHPMCPAVRGCVTSFGVGQSPCYTKDFCGELGLLLRTLRRRKEKAG